MKKPFLYAFLAALYIVFIALGMQVASLVLPAKDNIIMPMAMLSLFVLSAAIMGFLFLSEPIRLYMENQKHEAIIFFGKTVGFFACFAVFFMILVFIF
jgi:hypothetical protein